MDYIHLTTLGEFLVAIALCGGFGGMLSGHRQTGLNLPHYDRDRRCWSSGFLADVAFGVAGGLVVFLIVPADFSIGSTEKTVKFLGLSVLGGYAGTALLEKIMKETLKDIRKEQIQIRGKIEQQTKIIDADQKAIRLVDAFLNDTEDEKISAGQIGSAIKRASDNARFEIYQRTRSIRRKSWQTDKAAVGRTVQVFEALAGAGLPDRERHRLLAQWAYALKDAEAPDYERAAKLLDEAIELRTKEMLPPSAWYHFNRAVCRIMLLKTGCLPDDGALTQQIGDDLRLAAQNSSMADAIESSELVRQWRDSHPFRIQRRSTRPLMAPADNGAPVRR